MDDSPGPGLSPASHGHDYPPELAPGQPAPLAPGAPPDQSRPPVYKRAWFWILIGLGALMAGVVIAVVLIGILASTPETSTPVVVESTDFATATEGTEWTGDGWSAVVSGGALVITATEPGAIYPSWTELDGTGEVQVGATMSWSEGSLVADEFLVAGVMVFNDIGGGGYGVACGNDGYVYTVSIGTDESVLMDSYADAACLEDQFTLTLGVTSGSSTDILSVEPPGGENSVTAPGSVLGPFTEAGFVIAAEDESITPPGIAVHSVEVQAAQ